MQKGNKTKVIRPPQHQASQPGMEFKMKPTPDFFDGKLTMGNKLVQKVCVITGGDSGIGRAISVSFSREGAKTVLIYLNEQKDAKDTCDFIKRNFSEDCLSIKADIRKERNCKKIIDKVVKVYGRIDVLVNNAGIQYPQEKLENIQSSDLLNTFETNVFSMFYLSKYAMPYLKKGASIINTASVTAYRGSAQLIDYAASKGAIVSFTRSLSANLAKKGIRVNGVAPGPVWTPLIPASFKANKVAKFGSDVPLARAGEPYEVAPSYVFLASSDSSYMTGQFLHPNGGEIING
jgi:NAD(P)-dependent dehydrogenase (short-subunit alcohol dehydrogenase family)